MVSDLYTRAPYKGKVDVTWTADDKIFHERSVHVLFACVSASNGGHCLNFNKVNSRVKSPGVCNYLCARVIRRLLPYEKERRRPYGNLYGIQGKQPSNLREKYVKYWLHFIITWEPVVLATLSTLVPFVPTLFTFSHPPLPTTANVSSLSLLTSPLLSSPFLLLLLPPHLLLLAVSFSSSFSLSDVCFSFGR